MRRGGGNSGGKSYGNEVFLDVWQGTRAMLLVPLSSLHQH